MTEPRLLLPRATLRRIASVLDTPGGGFVTLARVAGLDPARDFRGADLRGVDFATDDLGGFDFSGADLTGADLSRARGLDRLITDAATRLPDQAQRPPPDFDPAEVERMIRRGVAPPATWRPFITALDLSGGPSSREKPDRNLLLLAGLTALQSLDLQGTQVSDVAPLAGLTALQSLDLRGTRVTDSSSVRKVPELLLPEPRSAGQIVSRVLRRFSQRTVRASRA